MEHLESFFWRCLISVGIDISKGKSIIIGLKPGDELVLEPKELQHRKEGLKKLGDWIETQSEEVRVVMEATGLYHTPVLLSLLERGVFTAVINPLQMKQFAAGVDFRKVKTDRADALKIARYGLTYWSELRPYERDSDIYQNLRECNRQYQHYMELRVSQLLYLDKLIDETFPRLSKLLSHGSQDFSRDKLSDFIEVFWHAEMVCQMSEDSFSKAYAKWTKAKEYQMSTFKPTQIFTFANTGIPCAAFDHPMTKDSV